MPKVPGAWSEEEQGARGERFEIRGKLGSGGVGVVYRAFDLKRGTEVALKTLRQVTGADLYRFKREFRTLADVHHPNLVRLHELHTRGDEWFLTMELVDGVPFIDWVRPPPPGSPAHVDEGSVEPVTPGGSDRFGLTGPTVAAPPPGMVGARQRTIAAEPDRARLDAAIYQLADTVHALHQAGKLHRDLKPSNVLVDRSGRVVVLDFGLMTEIEGATADRTHSAAAVGTPAYMSPEQADDLTLTPATDWYAVGVMLYEALTGRRPADLVDPRRRDHATLPPPPHRFDPRTPAHLDRLCMRLIDPDPARRPDGREVLAELGKEPSAASAALVRSLEAVPFVGREREIASLRGALADVRAGACVAVFVRGASGMGKTSLLRRFLDESAIAHDTVVLKGRCYERESVPFKTLDAVVDSLAQVLLSLRHAELAKVLPRDLAALARLFPVLKRLSAFAEPESGVFLPRDPLELRQRGFGALRTLLARLATQKPLVIAIDDVQWGDADSGTFFAELLHHPEAPPLLVVACHRSEDEDVTPLLAALRKSRAALGSSTRVASMRELTLGPLADGEARELLESLHPAARPWIDQAVRESGGSPMFLAELARGPDDDTPGAARGHDALGLDDLIAARVARLPEDARALLTVCAVAGRPLRSPIALAAAGQEGEGERVASLCAERLLRVRHPDAGRAELETYHDRIRAAVVSRLGDETRRRVHAALAAAISASPDPDHEALAEHCVEAGDPEAAARHARRAAEEAESRMAFHRAAELHALALAQGQHDEAARRELRTRLAHALAFAGRLDEAAATFALAAEDAPPGEKLELERLELEQLLRGGRLVLGLDKSRAVLAAVGHRLPRSQVGAVASLLAQRALLRLRGLDVDTRPRPPLPPAELQRIDVLWSVSSGLGFVNPVYGQVLQMAYLREALASHEPRHVGLAFCLEMGYLGLPGEKRRKQLDALLARALALSERTGDRELTGVAKAAGGLASFLCGRWRESEARFVDAEHVLRDECTRVRWQLDLLETFRASTLWFLGETRQLARVVPDYLRAAEERGDAYALRGLRGWRGNNLWLVLDQPAEARAQVTSVALPRTSEQPAQLTHFYELVAHTQIDLYQGDAERAHLRVESSWKDLKRAMLLRIQNLFVEATYLRARAALAYAALRPAAERRPLQARALKCARAIDAAGASWGLPYASTIRATVAHQLGDAQRAADELRAALSGFDAADMRLFVAAVRRRLGGLIGGEEGAAHNTAGEAFLRAQAVVKPETMVRMLVPGW